MAAERCPACGETETLQGLYAQANVNGAVPIVAGVGLGGHVDPDLCVQPPTLPVTCAWCGCSYSPSARAEAERYREVANRIKARSVEQKLKRNAERDR